MNSNTPSPQSEVSLKVSPAAIGCLILLISFFLPWINIFGASVAGHEIPKLSSKWQLLWAIPVASAIAMVLGFAGKRHVELAQVAGGLPLIGLSIALYQNGANLFKAFEIGAYTTLASGVFLLCVAPRVGRKPAAQLVPETPKA